MITMKIRLARWVVLLALLFAIGCSAPPTPIDTENLSPEQQKIVEEAEHFLGTSRIEFQKPPQVIRIEKTTPGRAIRFINRNDSISFGEKDAEKAAVWLVIFEGEMRIIPPDPNHTFTPGPFSHQCVYVSVNPVTHMNALRNTRCPKR